MNDAVKAKPSRVGILTPKAKTREQIRRALICLRCATFVFDELDELWRMGPRGLDIFIVDASLCEDASVLKWLRDLRLRLGSATQMVLLYTTTRFEGEKPDRVANLVLGVGGEMSFGAGVGASLAAVAERVESIVVAKSGHFVSEEQPDELGRVLLSFFKD